MLRFNQSQIVYITFWKKKKANGCKWSQEVHTHVVQGLTVHSVEYYSIFRRKKREGNPVICDNVDETGGHKWSKPI